MRRSDVTKRRVADALCEHDGGSAEPIIECMANNSMNTNHRLIPSEARATLRLDSVAGEHAAAALCGPPATTAQASVGQVTSTYEHAGKAVRA